MPIEEDEPVVILKRELAEKDELIRNSEERSQKLKSDFARYKKRVEEGEEAVRVDVEGELVKKMLSVADSLDRAQDSYNANADSGCEVVDRMIDGTRSNLEMTYNQLLTALGVTPIAPSPGEWLNDELHTAIETMPNTFLPDKAIVALVRKGYTLNGKVIRPAEVVISKGGEPETAKKESKSIIAKIVRGFESRVFRRKFEELETREHELGIGKRELRQNEEMLRTLAKELNLREEESKKMVEEGVKRREEVELRIHELEQSKEALNAELGSLKRQLRTIHESLSDMEAKKDKIVIENIALNNYNEKLLEEKERLLSAVEEMTRRKESLNAELKERIEDLHVKDQEMCLY